MNPLRNIRRRLMDLIPHDMSPSEVEDRKQEREAEKAKLELNRQNLERVMQDLQLIREGGGDYDSADSGST